MFLYPKRLTIVALSDMAYWTGKFETLGSNFSNETAFAGCLRPPTITAKVLFIKNIYILSSCF